MRNLIVEKHRVEKQIGASTLAFETGWLAKQAAGAVWAQYGETVVLVAVATGAPRPGIDFFPLTCDYRERTSAAGKFPGGFLKRESRPSTKEILAARLMDRPVRPLFPKGFNDEVQIQATVFSSDKQNDADLLAMNGSSMALCLSQLPFEGPIGSVRLGRIDNEWIVFPTNDQLEESELDLIVSGSRDSVLMIEGFSREMPEALMAEAILKCHEVIREIIDLQEELVAKVQPQKMNFVPPEDDGLYARLHSAYYGELKTAVRIIGKQARADAVSAIKERAKAEVIPDPLALGAILATRFATVWHDLEEHAVRETILEGTRPDGRGSKELRNIECYVDVLPRTHGSAVFQRGETQALISVTLGTARDEQRVDGLQEEYSKKFMLDYNFPSFSVGEVRPIRGPGRREIGHGALAERSVKPIMPPPEEFPYTVRVVSDILESNGSSSMASVCGATLGLMAAGVPITNPVAGISVGLVKETDDKWTLLTDIIGSEDHYGDMDFKIAGTQRGITGIQLDLKIKGISEAIIHATLEQSREARIEILRKMLSAIPEPRPEPSPLAPRLLQTKIDPDKIGLLIGPGGKNIRALQEDTGTVIEVEDDGTVTIASSQSEWAKAALERIEALTATVQVGKIYDGRVISIKDFGAFVEILPGRDGLCHISELSHDYVANVTDVVNVGDELKVLVISVDDHDRVKLSHRQALDELGLAPVGAGVGSEGGEGGERAERPRRDDRGGDRPRGGDRGGRGGDRGGRGGDRGGRGGGRGGDRGGRGGGDRGRRD
jgi:polyribonucleotide nucleotidyltransferase